MQWDLGADQKEYEMEILFISILINEAINILSQEDMDKIYIVVCCIS